jgi:hypothetical protein
MQGSRVARRALPGKFDSTPVVRKPSWRIMRIQQNARLIVATIAARRRLRATASAASDKRGNA